jgi:hypothetical protein
VLAGTDESGRGLGRNELAAQPGLVSGFAFLVLSRVHRLVTVRGAGVLVELAWWSSGIMAPLPGPVGGVPGADPAGADHARQRNGGGRTTGRWGRGRAMQVWQMT